MSQRGYSVDNTRHGRWRTYGLSRAPTRTQRTCMFAKMAYVSSINTSACLCNVSLCCVCRVVTQFKSRAMPTRLSAHESCDPSPPPPPGDTPSVFPMHSGLFRFMGYHRPDNSVHCVWSRCERPCAWPFFHGASTWVRQATGWLASPAHST